MIEDYRSMVRSDTQMNRIKAKYETLIKENNYTALGRQKDIRS
jgi:hypothetical protein